MKIRFGFVSNSSSTSFTCYACGQEHEYLGDVHPSEVEMVACKNKHVFHRDCLPQGTLINIDEEGNPDEFSTEFCPVCNFELIPDWDLNVYIYKNIDKQKFIDEIKTRFHSLEELRKYLRRSS